MRSCSQRARKPKSISFSIWILTLRRRKWYYFLRIVFMFLCTFVNWRHNIIRFYIIILAIWCWIHCKSELDQNAKGLFGWFFFITQFPSLIIHHFKIPHPFGTITHLSSLNIFHTICGPHTCYSVQFFFPPVPRNPNLVKEKKKKKKPINPNPVKKKKGRLVKRCSWVINSGSSMYV